MWVYNNTTFLFPCINQCLYAIIYPMYTQINRNACKEVLNYDLDILIWQML